MTAWHVERLLEKLEERDAYIKRLEEYLVIVENLHPEHVEKIEPLLATRPEGLE